MLKKIFGAIGLSLWGILFSFVLVLAAFGLIADVQGYIDAWKDLFKKTPKFDDILDDIDDVIGDED